MTRSNLCLKNSVKRALLINLFCLCLLISGCNYHTEPTYTKENIADSIRDIFKKEYNMDVTTKLTGSTVWIYVPMEDMLAETDKKKKPEKAIERFTIEKFSGGFEGSRLKLDYLIKTIPETEKAQAGGGYSEDAAKKRIYIWQVIARTAFSMKQHKTDRVEFFAVVMADIKKGIVIREIYNVDDFKKVSYGMMSYTEFQHRVVEETQLAPELIGDKTGEVIYYRDITMPDFIAWQILNRIKIKFLKPEVKQGVDIDKEVEKIIALTIEAYNFKDLSEAELNNLFSSRRIVLNRAAILGNPNK